MVFDSALFWILFAVVLLLYTRDSISWRGKKLLLLVTSYVFYGAWEPVFLLLLTFCCVLDYGITRALMRVEKKQGRWLLLLASLCTQLGLLGYFKYGRFLQDNFAYLISSYGVQYSPTPWTILLPVGISFYTFQSLSYTIDVYRRDMKAFDRFSDFALFVSFFPQLVAGPIVRAVDFKPQLEQPTKVVWSGVGWGLLLLVLGLFFKMVLADTFLAPVVDLAYNSSEAVASPDAWLATLAFSGQIYFDFAGYSLCAIGAARCLGFALPDNFNSPYAALGFSDFWRRWHISLSTWLRDYLYVPLGGNRRGVTRTYVNLALTMLLGGLWHGASWTFVVWGALHALYLVIERLLQPVLAHGTWASTAAARFGGWLLTYVATCFTWVFFRATSFEHAWRVVKALVFSGEQAAAATSVGNTANVVAIVGGMLALQWLTRNVPLSTLFGKLSWPVLAAGTAVLAIAIMISGGDDRAFIYFQF